MPFGILPEWQLKNCYMKYFWIVFIFSWLHSFAQNSFTSQVKVEYQGVVTDLNSSKLIVSMLLFNNDNAVFTYTKRSDIEEVTTSVDNSFNDYQINVNKVFSDTLENRIYFDKKQNTVIRTALDFNSKKKVYIKDSINVLEWEITSETKKINSFECIKATINSQGKRYTAWFTTDIPTSFGPFDFGQLLGLILELYSDDRQLFIAATKVTYPFEQEVLQPDADLEYISRSDYKDLTEKFLDSIAESLEKKARRILTKSQRGVKISNIKVKTRKNNKDKNR